MTREHRPRSWMSGTCEALVLETLGVAPSGERCEDAGVARRRRRRQQSRGTPQRGVSHGGVGRLADGASSGAEGEEAASGRGDGERLDALWNDSRSGGLGEGSTSSTP